MLKITRSNKKGFFNNFKTLNSKIKEIDKKRKNNISLPLFFSFNFDISNSKIKKIDEVEKDNFLFLLNKKKIFSISKRDISKDREIISLFQILFENEIDNREREVWDVIFIENKS